MSTHNILFELGCEELPPTSLKTLRDALRSLVAQGLSTAGLAFQKIEAFATPRRLALQIIALSTDQPDKRLERRGPAISAAFDAQGQPTQAAQGFAKSLGVTVKDLATLETDKGQWLFYEQLEPGKTSVELLPGIIETAIAQLPIAKRMRWGASKTEFVRPVHWATMLADNQTIKTTILGKATGQESYGHRFHHPGPINIATAMDYAHALKAVKVMASYEERRDSILSQIQQLPLAENAEVLIDAELLDEVSALVEWPVVMNGRFDASFLDVPAEALISSMQEHQKYFPVVHKDTGKLMPYFVFVSNLVSKQPNAIIEGNERVIRPRLADAAFFWNTDRKTPLADRVVQLDKVLFQKRLGTLLEKTERIESLAIELAKSLQITANLEHIQRAARLSKADLVSEMVFEFGDMQGIAGRYYAEHDGEPASVALAIQEHYQPKQAGDALPSEITGQMVALADRLDTLVGIFGIGQRPTGTKDPFALRRASLSVLRILIETHLDLDLKAALMLAVAQYQKQGKVFTQPDLIETLLNYILDRLSAWYQDQNIPVEVFQAVRARNIHSPLDIDLRVKAVHYFYQQDAALALASAAKRVSNLLNKAEGQIPDHVDPRHFKEDAEVALYKAIRDLETLTLPLFKERNYQQALDKLATLRQPVDHFFETVMVMTDDETVKLNRLALLNELRQLFLKVAEISHLQVAN